jgi:hypothetical protein
MTNFYDNVEEGVRMYVKAFRDAGLNTFCSCHHEGYIQIESYDPTREADIIYNILVGFEVKDYTAELECKYTPAGYFRRWHIESPWFKI